ncbi:hypothetical protein GOBAR_AA08178 [Gossypium barbadense]|uniref:Uncharacterized protein n=1 Tax=Gossypium barbadense TaxID=3634 RepID=A0A2P5YA49_GOSBA|nr:hypothetical protein GOBAR_AA08178 [Gossypium barbadense]
MAATKSSAAGLLSSSNCASQRPIPWLQCTSSPRRIRPLPLPATGAILWTGLHTIRAPSSLFGSLSLLFGIFDSVFHVENMHVTNFNTDANPFTARWETEIRIENPNTKLYLYVDGMEVFMNYNDKYDVGFTWINPMFMESKNKTSMQVVINTGESAHHAVPIWIAQDMGKDQKNGGVNFVLKIKVWVTLKSGMWLWFRRSLMLNVECDDLKVNFGNSSREGTLEYIKDREDCYVST